jgi:hypothetical protein
MKTADFRKLTEQALGLGCRIHMSGGPPDYAYSAKLEYNEAGGMTTVLFADYLDHEQLYREIKSKLDRIAADRKLPFRYRSDKDDERWLLEVPTDERMWPTERLCFNRGDLYQWHRNLDMDGRGAWIAVERRW